MATGAPFRLAARAALAPIVDANWDFRDLAALRGDPQALVREAWLRLGAGPAFAVASAIGPCMTIEVSSGADNQPLLVPGTLRLHGRVKASAVVADRIMGDGILEVHGPAVARVMDIPCIEAAQSTVMADELHAHVVRCHAAQITRARIDNLTAVTVAIGMHSGRRLIASAAHMTRARVGMIRAERLRIDESLHAQVAQLARLEPGDHAEIRIESGFVREMPLRRGSGSERF